MGKTLFTGGMKSGKSLCAERFALQFKSPRLYVATAEAFDDETRERVRNHQARRGGSFETIEEPLCLERCFEKAYGVIMIDCLTFWYNNLFYHFKESARLEERLDAFTARLEETGNNVVLVTNEVGWGVVPENKLARQFVDFSGKANQRVQEICDRAYLVVAGAQIQMK